MAALKKATPPLLAGKLNQWKANTLWYSMKVATRYSEWVLKNLQMSKQRNCRRRLLTTHVVAGRTEAT
jgi:hypothetical protein